MNRLLHVVVRLAWGLWFGGLVMLFLAVQSLFATFADRHDLAGEAASDLFARFNRYRLIVAGVAIVGVILWWVVDRVHGKLILSIMLGLAVLAAIYGTLRLTPQLEELRVQGQTHTPAFAQLHGISMAIYSCEALCVLAGGLFIPTARNGSRLTA